MEFDFVKQIRNQEIDQIITILKARRGSNFRLLEIGAGGGWQAKRLSEAGIEVQAIDIETSRYRNDRNFKVVEFDGVHIPYPDNYFDVIFSSNVLEHVQHPLELGKEIDRCMKADGIQLHLVPSGTWRLFTTLTYYPFVLKYILKKFIRIKSVSTNGTGEPKTWKWYQKLLPTRHGETGNWISELYWFSRFGWEKNFKKWHFQTLTRLGSNNLFYTGSNLLGSFLPIKIRKVISSILGSSCHIYEGSKGDV
jgi:ubiquinone/menaquinone biosynthesis C-methylase UbiE